MNLIDRLTVISCKFISLGIKMSGKGAGATWPGEIALRLRPRILESLTGGEKTIILVAGTNGKTTTSKLIETILKNAGKRVRHNASGANLDNGIVSGFLSDATWSGRLKSRYFIFEVDEATLPNILRQVTPSVLVLLNLFRDQLDRYGEVDTIAEKWTEAIVRIPTTTKFVINADDPHLAFIGTKVASRVSYFGLENQSLYLPKMQHATDSIYCPNCGHRLTFGGVYFSHLGKWACGNCGFTHPEIAISSKDFTSPLEGVYNKYNTIAASMVCRILGIHDSLIIEGLEKFTPAFGRMEELFVDGKKVKILLSKNPTGFNESLRTVQASKSHGPLLLILNDRIPDGTDVSWIFDVDFETLHDQHVIKERDEHLIFVSGDRCHDLAVRLKYAGISTTNLAVYEQLGEAIHNALTHTKAEETMWILATYSAMLDARKILVGRKIL